MCCAGCVAKAGSEANGIVEQPASAFGISCRLRSSTAQVCDPRQAKTAPTNLDSSRQIATPHAPRSNRRLAIYRIFANSSGNADLNRAFVVFRDKSMISREIGIPLHIEEIQCMRATSLLRNLFFDGFLLVGRHLRTGIGADP